jgi:hypothetical protein
VASEQDMALNDLGQTHKWETDDLPLLRRLMSQPPDIWQRQMEIIRKLFAFFHELYTVPQSF